MSVEATTPAAMFKDRHEAQRYFAGLNDVEINDRMDVAFTDAAEVAPEVFYSQAARAISFEYFDTEGMPSEQAAFAAMLDFAYVWRACRTESRLKRPSPDSINPYTGEPLHGLSSEDYGHLSGTRGELLFAAALAGARASGMDMVARISPAVKDYMGGELASDLEVHTSEKDYSLQLKNHAIGEDCLHYDLDKVVIVSLPLFVEYLNMPGNTPEEKLTPFKAQLARIADLPEHIAAGQDDPELVEETLIFMQIFGTAMQEYMDDRPDIAVVQAIRDQQIKIA